MLSFRNKLVKTDPEVIRQIAASTGFFDRQDVQINVEIAENLLNQKDSEHKFLFADYMDKTVAYVCYGEVPDAKEGTYEIYWLSTLNEYRGLGIGRNLINKLITKLRKKALKRFMSKPTVKINMRQPADSITNAGSNCRPCSPVIMMTMITAASMRLI